MLVHDQNRFHLKNCSFALPNGVYLLCDDGQSPYEFIIGIPGENWQIEISFEQLKDGASQFFFEEDDKVYFPFIGEVQTVSLGGTNGYYSQYRKRSFP